MTDYLGEREKSDRVCIDYVLLADEINGGFRGCLGQYTYIHTFIHGRHINRKLMMHRNYFGSHPKIDIVVRLSVIRPIFKQQSSFILE